MDALLEKLTEVGEVAKQVGATAVLDGGDFFHVKSPTRNSHYMLQKVAKLHWSYPCPVYANIGNHDVKYGDWTFLEESPLGVLLESGVFKPCYDQHEAVFTKDGLTVRVVGIPYHGTTYDMDRFTRIKKGDEDYLVVMAHVLASKEGGSMFEGEDIIRYADLKGLDPDVWCFGHWHKNQGVTEIDPGKFVVNIGSLSRGSLSQDDLRRVPEMAVMSFGPQGINIQRRPLSTVRPPEEVFDLVGRARMETRDMTMEHLVASFQAALSLADDKTLEEMVREMPGISSETRERALAYLESA